jgi:Glycosyltransferase family 87
LTVGADTAFGDLQAMSTRRRPAPWQAAIFAAIPAIWIGSATIQATSGRGWSVTDFLTFRAAAWDLLHGRSPYPHVDPSVLAAGRGFVYPPIAAYPFIPFTALPAHVAIIVYLLASLVAIALALWLVGVRDWRVLGVVLLWEPVLMWLLEGPIEPWMLLLLACAWRWRTHTVRLAAIVALLVSLKLFMWPLLVWLLATRRNRAFLASVAMTAVFVLVPFASVGLHALRTYPHLLQTLTNVFGPTSFSILGVLHSVASRQVSDLATIGAALALVGLTAFLGSREDGDRRALSAAVVGAVMVSPIVWGHYYVLLALPIALARPRLSLLWFAPLAFWATGAAALGEPHRLAIGLLIPLVVLFSTCRKRAPDYGDGDRALERPTFGTLEAAFVQSTGSGSGSASPAMR